MNAEYLDIKRSFSIEVALRIGENGRKSFLETELQKLIQLSKDIFTVLTKADVYVAHASFYHSRIIKLSYSRSNLVSRGPTNIGNAAKLRKK